MKPYFLRRRQLKVDGITMYGKRKRHKYCYKSLQSALDKQNLTTDRMTSKVVTKHLCNYRNSFYKYFFSSY